MSFFKRFFFKKQEEDFETVLATLASDIQKRQVQLSEIRLREKRSALLATTYTLLTWFAYTSLWYWNGLPYIFQTAAGNHAVVERIARGLPVFIGPIVILFIRRIVVVWYTRKADAEEKALQHLMKRRRTKVDEIKKKTNFDSMVKLFQEYDEPSPAATPLRRRLQHPQQTPVTPQRHPGPFPSSQANTPVPVSLQDHLTPVPNPFPMAPPQKKWYDKVADTILGDDDHEVGSPSSRYALICERCFTHNGLIKESMWEDTQFVCRNPSCNHFNRSFRSKRQVSSAHSSPQSSTSSPPDHVSRNSPSATPSPQQRPSMLNESGGDSSNADAPTVDPVDAGIMEVDS